MRNVLALTLAALLLAPAHARDYTDLDEKGAENCCKNARKINWIAASLLPCGCAMSWRHLPRPTSH